jgi:hypothetical protein
MKDSKSSVAKCLLNKDLNIHESFFDSMLDFYHTLTEYAL